ncbi:hypothetical protein [Hyalangium minutum]|uniref:Lipoprotein n=1 Tax=Hyalangium minutum TaxID=394096 RepID=A0A085W768_9BACT|nr:hypothetical protein [Hyalangium minutum]KFE63531.1 hypothetical protein DB31_2649 [Hyalangium minutum]
MPRLLSLALLLTLSTFLLGSDCGEHEAVSLEELRRDVAPPFDYSLYCDPSGTLVGDRSAVLLVHRSEHLERVYADAQAGDARARTVFAQLESAVRLRGAGLANEALGFTCATAPACALQWHFQEELIPSRQAGGTRLRELLAASFERQAKLKGVSNAVLNAALNVLVAGTVLKPGAGGAAEAKAATAEARASSQEAGQLSREATLGRQLMPSHEARTAVDETAAAFEARFAEAEAIERGPRYSVRVEELERYRPAYSQPPSGVPADHPRWSRYVTYWERRYDELTGKRPLPPGESEAKLPLTWRGYDALLGRFQRAREFQHGVTQAMQQEARAAGRGQFLPQEMKRPLVVDNLGLARGEGAPITYADQFVVDEATLGPGKRPQVHTYSTKQHDFSGKRPADASKQFLSDAQEAMTKYGGTVEVRRRGHPLFGQKVVVSRVHIVYDGEKLAGEIREALFEQAQASGVELHFHVP